MEVALTQASPMGEWKSRTSLGLRLVLWSSLVQIVAVVLALIWGGASLAHMHSAALPSGPGGAAGGSLGAAPEIPTWLLALAIVSVSLDFLGKALCWTGPRRSLSLLIAIAMSGWAIVGTVALAVSEPGVGASSASGFWASVLFFLGSFPFLLHLSRVSYQVGDSVTSGRVNKMMMLVVFLTLFGMMARWISPVGFILIATTIPLLVAKIWFFFAYLASLSRLSSALRGVRADED